MPQGSRFWEERLKSFEDKSLELREKTRELEDEIHGLENSLYRRNITSYRAALLDNAKKTFVKIFRQRDELTPEPEAREAWEELSNTMSACMTIIKAIDTEEAGVCGSAEELKNYLKSEIEARGVSSSEETESLLEHGFLKKP